MSERLVIFDCDGVLVDSEPIAITVMRETAAEVDYSLDEETAYRRFLGKSKEDEERLLRDGLDIDIDPAAMQRMQLRLLERLRLELEPVTGIHEALSHLQCLRCVASSGWMERIRLSLSVTGLLENFEPHIFSADSVANGKPAPDLFLHAASAVGVAPRDCVVVVDSPAGILGAQRAGMTVFAFLGGSHAGPAGLHRAAQALDPDALFSDMRELPDLISILDESAERMPCFSD